MIRRLFSCLPILFVLACDGEDPPPGGVDASDPNPIDAPAGTIDGPAACADLRGTWRYSGQCGNDTCVIAQTGCATSLDCVQGSASYTGTVSGNGFTYQGTTAGGQPATCTGTVNGGAMSGSCSVQGAPCTFTGIRQ